jgi:peptide/nickel transport system permease protein
VKPGSDLGLNLPLAVGASIVAGLFVLVLFGPVWAPTNPYIAAQRLVPHYDASSGEYIDPPLAPSDTHPLGTDRWGNDLLSLLMHGARNTLVACAFITMARVGLGLVLGAWAGWNEGKVSDRLIMGTVGVITSVPVLISSIVLIYALDIRQGLPVFIVALSLVGWTEIAQYIRGEFLVLRKAPFVEGARAVGLNGLSLVVRHVLPNVLPQLLVISFLEMGAVMMLLGELGFVGVYIGGGSRIAIEIDPRTVEYHSLVEVPEWGAMLADGFRWLRTRPFVVWPPALAFFVSVVGFNALGEGLRQLIERRGMSTAFLVRGRAPVLRPLLAAGILALATAFIIRNTGPAPWFARLAQSFDGERAYGHVDALVKLDGRGAGQEGGREAAAYIADRFRAYGLEPGGKDGGYLYSLRTQLVRPQAQPYLALLGTRGMPVREFRHQRDFSFVIKGHGGSGDVEAPLVFVGFVQEDRSSAANMGSGYPPSAWESFKGLDLRDRIVLLWHSGAPPDFASEALIRGARGILWIGRSQSIYNSGSGACGYSQVQLLDAESLRKPQIPSFCITLPTASALLEATGHTIDDLSSGDPLVGGGLLAEADQTGPGWYATDLGVSVHMSLNLGEPQHVEVPCVLGFKAGSDYDLAGQLVVLFTSYDGLGRDPDGTVYPAANRGASGVAVLLELARLWQEQKLDARRSVMFVAWGGGLLEEPGADLYLRSRSSFRTLPSTSPVRPTVLFQWDAVGAGGDELVLHPRSSRRLAELVRETAAQAGVPMHSLGSGDVADSGQVRELRVASMRTPWIYITRPTTPPRPTEDKLEQIEADMLQEVGETLALALTRVVRQTSY